MPILENIGNYKKLGGMYIQFLSSPSPPPPSPKKKVLPKLKFSSIIHHLTDCLSLRQGWMNQTFLVLSFDHWMWQLYLTSMWRLYPTNMWRLYPNNLFIFYTGIADTRLKRPRADSVKFLSITPFFCYTFFFISLCRTTLC